MSGEILEINQWCIEGDSGRFWQRTADSTLAESVDQVSSLEPKACALLFYLAMAPGKVHGKDELLSAIWPDTVVTEDALTRCISKLRKALQDDPRQPKLIATLPKRGYRLVADHIQLTESKPQPAAPIAGEADDKDLPPPNPVSSDAKATRMPSGRLTAALTGVTILLLVAIFLPWPESDKNLSPSDNAEKLIDQADDYYFQIRRADNETAIELYQQAIALRPESAAGQAGLANALVQKTVRWSNPIDEQEAGYNNLREALASGHLASPESRRQLDRAQALAERAVRLAPENSRVHRSLGFVYSAQGKFEAALTAYHKAVQFNPDAWGALINIGDVLEITGRPEQALPFFEKAYAAMTRLYEEQSARIMPWYADMGALIGEKYADLGQPQEAEVWFRKVLSQAPLNIRASLGLARILADSGDVDGAIRLCRDIKERVDPSHQCDY
ncbi:tetratricopeptide repeat protein [Bowmanella dokdonensis]|uniref:Tetratricopeptide repeat protein n=1 Tax=Bowmanella dokdonensis TaxID=751969 RepID=A0A939DMU7_9ALTE|nr:tetratricopeptide repeat protein [Bowmanella dokdonensis]MBN7825679.1 tetratricopeptide repeat protein [Bowmanella dokdonensis]